MLHLLPVHQCKKRRMHLAAHYPAWRDVRVGLTAAKGVVDVLRGHEPAERQPLLLLGLREQQHRAEFGNFHHDLSLSLRQIKGTAGSHAGKRPAGVGPGCRQVVAPGAGCSAHSLTGLSGRASVSAGGLT